MSAGNLSRRQRCQSAMSSCSYNPWFKMEKTEPPRFRRPLALHVPRCSLPIEIRHKLSNMLLQWDALVMVFDLVADGQEHRPGCLQHLVVLGLRMSSSRQSNPERRYPIYVSITLGKAEEPMKREGGRGFAADLWSRDQSAMQLLMVVLPPQHQPRHLQRDVHCAISAGRKRLVLGHSVSFPTSCKSKKRGPSSHIIGPLLRKKAAGVGRQLCSSMVGVGCSAPSQRNHDWTHNTLLPPRRASPYHMLPDDSTNLPLSQIPSAPTMAVFSHLEWAVHLWQPVLPHKTTAGYQGDDHSCGVLRAP